MSLSENHNAVSTSLVVYHSRGKSNNYQPLYSSHISQQAREMGLYPGWATVSVIVAAAAFGVCLLLCVFMCFCYFPGGRKFSDVIAVHELSKYDLSGKGGDYDEDYDEESQSEYGTNTSVGVETTESKLQKTGSGGDLDDLPIRRGPQMMEI